MSQKLRVTEEKLTPGTMIYDWNQNPDYYDAFSIEFNSKKKVDVLDSFRSFFYSFPSWFQFLLSIRERVAGWLGLKTVGKGNNPEEELERFNGEPGDSIALFNVFGRNENELLTGEDDNHLDFRLSFIMENLSDERYRLTLITSVKMNALIGRLYFIPVRPIHRIIVPICCRRIVKRMTA